MIKWCLYLRHVSGRAYKILRSSGCVTLPSQRTLSDYTHYVSALTGFSTDIDKQLALAVDDEPCSEMNKYTVLIINEMYIKEDLVYNKHTGALIGFVNLGETNSHLLQFERSLESDPADTLEPLTKTMLMVRGLFSSLEFPYVQFPCGKFTGDLLFDPFWEAVRRVEMCGLKVLAATADGVSPNHCFFRIHNLSTKVMPHRVLNPYASEERYLYFVCDVPHLLKTIQNGLASKKRNLWVSSQDPFLIL